MHAPPFSLCLLLFFSFAVRANVEKTIFLAPASTTIPSVEPDIDDLGLDRLSPLRPVVRTRLNASFPTEDAPHGTDTWLFLENMRPGQRYEVRICWLATQPTSFSLSTYTLTSAMEDASLLSSISHFSSTRLASLDAIEMNSISRKTRRTNLDQSSADPEPTSDSVLFLRIQAAADYYTLDRSLMENVPPVLADVVLDPFLLNLFPRSLVPTAGWITVVAVLAILVAQWVTKEFRGVIEDAEADRAGRKGEDKKSK